MLHKTTGIVLNFIKYRESSIILKIYTQHFGLQSYIENGVRSSKGKNKIALFQPLTILDLVVYHDPKKEIHRIAEIKCSFPYHTIPFEIKKSSIGLFVNEVIIKCLKEHEENQPLFHFLSNSLKYLDQSVSNFENFHLFFLVKLSNYLGFGASTSNEISQQILSQAILVDSVSESIINHLILQNFDYKLDIGIKQRTLVLGILLQFYALHIENFGKVKSIEILKEVLS